MTTTNRSAGSSWLDGVLVIAVLGLAGLLGCAIIRNSDIWQHLAAGRLIAQGQYHFGVDPFCFTTGNEVWVNHAWGFDFGLYHVFQQSGGAGLVILRCAIVLIMTLALLMNRRSGAGFAAPAMLTTLALVAANIRLPVFQPVTVSFMVLAILMWLLQCGPRWRNRWMLPFAVFVLHAYWVNHDGWFVIGPVTIFVWLIGSLLESPSADEPSAGYWFAVLMCSILGSVLNPHHFRAFTIPDELIPTLQGVNLGGQGYFNPFDVDFRRSQPAPVIAAVAMFSIGLASFAAALPAISWRRLIVFSAFAALGVWRARMMPFFAVAAAPLIARNLQEAIGTWEPTANRRLISVAVRSVAALAVVGLGFAAWPGWLGPVAYDTLRASRVGIKMEVNAGLERLAFQLVELQQAGALSEQEHVFSPSTDVSHYLAWYAPSLKSFVDNRWRLHSARLQDFIAVRQLLSAPDLGQDGTLEKINTALKPYSITLLLLNGSERYDGTGPGRFLMTNPERWPLLALKGKATAFSWTADAKHPRQPLNVPRLAFAPQSATPMAPPPDEEPRIPSAWDTYARGLPARPVDLDESISWLDYTDASQFRIEIARSASALTALFVAPVGHPAWSIRTVMEIHPGARIAPVRVASSDRIAAPLLAVRSGRAALAAQYGSAEAAYRLSMAYSRLVASGDDSIQRTAQPQSPMRPIGSLVALQRSATLIQAQSRLNTLVVEGRDESQLAYRIANDLTEFYRKFNTPQTVCDLFVDSFRTAFEQLRKPRVVEMFQDPKAYEAEFNGRKKQLEAMDKMLAAQREHLITDESQPIVNRMQRAEQCGLLGEALAVFQRSSAQKSNQISIAEMNYVIRLLLLVGRAEDARTILYLPQFNPVTAMQPAFQQAFRRLHLDAAVACGDYQRAHEELTHSLEFMRLLQAQGQAAAAGALASGAISLDPMAAPFLSRSFDSFMWTSPFDDLFAIRYQRFELLAWQAMIALEQGDTRTAKRALDEALEDPPRGPAANEVEALKLYKLMLDRAAAIDK